MFCFILPYSFLPFVIAILCSKIQMILIIRGIIICERRNDKKITEEHMEIDLKEQGKNSLEKSCPLTSLYVLVHMVLWPNTT